MMKNISTWQVREADPGDRQQLSRLIQFSPYIHRHLDWFDPMDWIGCQPFMVAEWNNHLDAVLACPPEPEEIAWIRLFAVSREVTVRNGWERLWPVVMDAIAGLNLIVAAIPIYPWFREILTESHFKPITDVVLLIWEHYPLPPVPKEVPFIIRDMGTVDLPLIHQVDLEAFDPLWQNSKSSLESAWTKSVIATVAEAQGQIIGYQMSTSSSSGGHLARLAVLPEWQGCGVGTALIRQMLTRFHLWGSQRVTVNTQIDNIASLALYQKVGFRRTDECYPVYLLVP